MEGGFTMSKRIVFVIFVAALVAFIPLSLAFAGNRSGGPSGSGGSPDIQSTQTRMRNQDQQCEEEPLMTQDRTRERLQDSEEPLRTRDRERLQKLDEENAYLASDGKTYEWKRNYTVKAQKYEESQNVQALNSYLNRIANRFRFQHEKDVEGFVKWAQQNKPWNL
jgi:membrane protein involved in colicin uptake